MPEEINGYPLNLRRSNPDIRDWQFTPPVDLDLPATYDFDLPRIYDQLPLGACSANAEANVFDHIRRELGMPYLFPSRLFEYYNSRLLEGTVGFDSGASIRDCVEAARRYGAIAEDVRPYVIADFKTPPTVADYVLGLDNQVTEYRAVAQDQTTIKSALAARKPIIFGFAVYESFRTIGNDGLVPMPSGGLLGYHANVLCGYPEAGKKRSANSWGTGHGRGGYLYFPDAYILNPQLCFDFQVIDLVEGPAPGPGIPTEAQLWMAFDQMRVSTQDPVHLDYIRTNDIGQWIAKAVYGNDRHDSDPPQYFALDP